jgi:hypothetical protein
MDRTSESSSSSRALKLAENACRECGVAVKRFASDTDSLTILHDLDVALNRTRDRLESVVDDDEICERFHNIRVGEPIQELQILDGICQDLQVIYEYLQKASAGGLSVNKSAVEVYIHVLHRYSEVFKLLQKKSLACVTALLLIGLMMTE